MLHIEGDDIAVLRMENGKVNALDADFLKELTETLGELQAKAPRAVILTGTGGVFSAGADLRKVLDSDEAYIADGLDWLGRAFAALFAFPRPVVAAVNGHAIAGGAVLACACDYRVMARGSGLIGLAELKVGVPFPVAALEVVRYAVTHRYFQELIYFGDTYDADEGLMRGLVDEVVETGHLMSRATEVAERLASIPAESFSHTKRIMRAPALERIAANAPEFDPNAARLWAAPETRASIDAVMKALRG